MKECEKCKEWNNGDGSKACFSCPVLNKYHKMARATEMVVDKCHNKFRVNRDYKEVLEELSTHMEFQTFKKKRTPMLHKAVVILAVFNFKRTDMARLFNVSRQTIYDILGKYSSIVYLDPEVEEE